MDYASLIADKSTTGSIKRWVNYGDVDSEQTVAEAMSWINERLRVPAMRTIATGTISTNAETLAFPTNFIEEIWFGHVQQAAGRIKGRRDHDLETARSYNADDGTLLTGCPYFYSLGGSPPTAIFDKKADRAYAYRLVYFARMALDGTTTTNWLTSYEPRVLRCVCVAFANEFLKRDSEKTYWLQQAENQIATINARWEMQLKDSLGDVSGGY